MSVNKHFWSTGELENTVIDIVKQAVLQIKDTEFDIMEKDELVNIVTTSDIAVQRFLRDKLQELLPQSGFFCEEEDLRDSGHEYIWVIDPIDGTTNYSRGIAECAISVALLHHRQAIVGVVYNIFSGDIFSATSGLGARMNGKSISVSHNSFENGLLCTAMSLYKKELAAACRDIIYEAYMQCNDIRRLGSCAIELCYLAAGKCDLYFEIRVFPWDYAAAYLILEEAGGVLTGLDGEKLGFDKPTALIGANSRENYDRLDRIVSKYINGEG